IGAGVAHALGAGMKDDAVDESPADNLHALPGVWLRREATHHTHNGSQNAHRRRQELPLREHESPQKGGPLSTRVEPAPSDDRPVGEKEQEEGEAESSIKSHFTRFYKENKWLTC